MKIDVLKTQKNDTVVVLLPVGNLANKDVDAYVEKTLKPLKKTFGCKVCVIPNREINEMDFTVIRKNS